MIHTFFEISGIVLWCTIAVLVMFVVKILELEEITLKEFFDNLKRN